MKTISSEEWEESYGIHLDEWGNPKPYETYGDDLQVVLENRNKVWTMLETDNEESDENGYVDNTLVVSGYHWVNRIHHFIGTKDVPAEDIQVDW